MAFRTDLTVVVEVAAAAAVVAVNVYYTNLT
jgi:hypothetical protein